MAGYRLSYTIEEDNIILINIIENQAYYKVGGNVFWKKLEAEGIINRTWQSLKNRFQKHIITNISSNVYKLPEIEKRKLGLAYYQLSNQFICKTHSPKDSNSDTDSDIDVVNDKKSNKKAKEDTSSNSSFEFTILNKLSYLHNVGEEPLRPLTIGRLLEYISENYGNTTALISCHQNVSLSFNNLLDEADRLAAGLRKIGFKKGDKIGLWAPNMAEWYVSFMACARGGYIMVPMNPYYQTNEIMYSIKKVGVNALIFREESLKTHNFCDIINQVCPNLSKSRSNYLNHDLPSLKSVINIGKDKKIGTHIFDEVLDMANNDGVTSIKKEQKLIKIDDPCCIQFTSGTTGLSKAPVVSHFSVVNNGYFIGKRNGLHKKHHTLCIQNPLFHAYGSVIGLLGALNHATTVVLPSDRYDVEKNLNALKNHQCTIIYGTPTMYVDLVNLQREKKEKICLETAVSGGAICSPHLFKNMIEILGVKYVKSIYGLTETSGSTFQTQDDDDINKCTKTVGYLQEHLEAKVIDETGCIVPIGVTGELCVRGYSVMLNYYGDEEKTNEAKTIDGWFRTGDLVSINSDGYAEITGRLKDMIIRGGENIYPREIEDFLDKHPDIIEAQVIGLPHERLGEEVCACLRTKNNKNLTVNDIKEFCLGKIATFKIPSIIKIMTEFPKTTSGKVQKVKLVEIFKNNK